MLPLTAVRVACAAYDGLEMLAADVSSYLDYTAHWTIERAAALGDVRLLQRVVDDYYRDDTSRIIDPHYIAHITGKALVLAVRHDNAVELLECLLDNSSLAAQVSATRAASEAAALGKVHVLQWLHSHCCNIAWTSCIVHRAAAAGHVRVLEWLDREVADRDRRMFNYAIERAAMTGHVAAVAWLHEYAQRPDAAPTTIVRTTLKKAIAHGQLGAAEWLHARGYTVEREPYNFAIVCAVDLRFVQWLATNGYSRFCMLALEPAAAAGRSDVVQWLLEQVPDDSGDQSATSTSNSHSAIVELLQRRTSMVHYKSALASAAACGALDLVQWLVRRMQAAMSSCDVVDDEPVDAALAHSHSAVAEWLHAQRPDTSHTVYRLDEAAAAGDLHGLQWAVEHSVEHAPRAAVHAAAANGHLRIVQWLLTRFANYGTVWLAIDAAAANGHLDVAQWLHASQRDGCTPRAMDEAAANGHLETVKWLHAHRTEGCTAAAMDAAARNNHLDVVKWLHEHRTEGCTTRAMNDAAASGAFETLLFLHIHQHESCTVRAFKNAFNHNYQHIALWLYDNCPVVSEGDALVSFMRWNSRRFVRLRSGTLLW